MNILNLSPAQDTGGQQGRMTAAFRKHAPDWGYTAVTRRHDYYDIETVWNARHIRRELWPSADVIHAHNNFRAISGFQRNQPKPCVIHYHGTAFRASPSSCIAEQRRRGAIGLVSTLDLWLLAPDDTEWLPSPHDLDWLASLR